MRSNRRKPLVGAFRIHLLGRSGDADLGGVASLSRFVTLFPIGLVLLLGVVLSVVFGVVFGPGTWIAVVATVVGGNAALWSLLGPMMAQRIRARTDRALD